MRPVCVKDSKLILDWRNDITTRIWCFNDSVISLNQHLAWFQEFLQNPKNYGFVLEVDARPVGFIKYEPHKLYKNSLIVSIVVDPQSRSKGYGKYLLEKSLEKLKNSELSNKIDFIVAEILENNTVSEKLFSCVGFYKVDWGLQKSEKKYSEWFKPLSEKVSKKPFGVVSLLENFNYKNILDVSNCFNLSRKFFLNIKDFTELSLDMKFKEYCNQVADVRNFYLFMFFSKLHQYIPEKVIRAKANYEHLLENLTCLAKQIHPDKLFLYQFSDVLDNENTYLSKILNILNTNNLPMIPVVRSFSDYNKRLVIKQFLFDLVD